MALDNSALLELTEALRSADDGQLMRKLLHTNLQALIDAEAAEHIGADPHCCIAGVCRARVRIRSVPRFSTSNATRLHEADRSPTRVSSSLDSGDLR